MALTLYAGARRFMPDGGVSDPHLLDEGLIAGCSHAVRLLKCGLLVLADERARLWRVLGPRATLAIAFDDCCVG
eukprot:8451636-Pyramimonas_sp.AAC.1